MTMHPLDIAIIVFYMLLLVVIATYLKKRATNSMDDYFLGGRQMPWWTLGVTGMAAWLDMTGTMIITAFLFMLGPRGLFVEFRGGAGLVLIFCMLWLGKWHRRSGCMTGAEWMIFRFGKDNGAHAARLLSAVSMVIFTAGILAYSFIGAGLFLSTFLPFQPWVCTLILVIITTLYTVQSGFYGVVVTDIFQMLLVVIGVVCVTVMAVIKVRDHGGIADVVFEVTGNSQWFSSVPNFQTTMPKGYEQYNALFSITMFYLLKTIVQGLGVGGEPKYFGARNDRECGLLSFLQGWLMSIRWVLMIAFVILGLFLVKDWFPDQAVLSQASTLIKSQVRDVKETEWAGVISNIVNHKQAYPVELISGLESMLGPDWSSKLYLINFEGEINAERIMPSVLASCIPIGIRGLLLVALLAAAMSTINAFLNMATGFFTRDIYQAYLRPKAHNKELILASYGFGVVLVSLSFIMAYTSKNINDIWGWITMSLGGGMIVPFALRLYWWRFNGYGFAIGTFFGMIASLVQRLVWPAWPETHQFIFTIAIGLIASVIGTYLTKPTDPEVLKNYYHKIRPFGLWAKLKETLSVQERARTESENRNDLISLPFAFFWQVTILLLPLQLLIGSYKDFVITFVILVLSLVGLYVFWYQKLDSLDREAERITDDADIGKHCGDEAEGDEEFDSAGNKGPRRSGQS
ncbi:MAG: sodium:solute symporter [Planctomycetes bacterium GWF2_42_9]|nr:MAG: sodium:solute symporter [Planctomycetes bacterium GWF2_42_9]